MIMNTLRNVILLALFLQTSLNSELTSDLNIGGYTSYKRFNESITQLISAKTLDAINFVFKYSASEPTGLLSYTTPDVIIFFQLFYSVVKDKQTLTNLLIEITKHFEKDNRKKTGIQHRNWLEREFDFVADDIYYFVQTIAHGHEKGINNVPKVLSDQIILIEKKYYIFERACTTGDEKTVDWFLKSGFKLNELDVRVLSHVFFKGYLNIIKLLLEYDYLKVANVPRESFSEKHLEEQTFLHVAAATGLNDTIIFLLDKGALIDPKDIHGRTPLYKAVENNQVHSIQILIQKGADKSIVYGDSDNSILHVAVYYKHIESVKALLDSGVPVKLKNSKGEEPMHVAARQSDVAMISFLLKSNADINARDYLGNTPLHIAAFEGNLTCVKHLLSLNANYQIKNELGRLPFHKSVEGGHLEIIKELYRINPNVLKATMNVGDTVTHLASDSGNKRVLETLLKLGAPPNIKNYKEQVPLLRAALKGNNEVVSLLKNSTDLNSMSLGMTMLHQAALEGNAYAVKLLVSTGIKVDSRGLWGNTPLHLAAGLGFTTVVQALLDNKANPNLKNKYGMTSLHKAAIGGHLETIKLLDSAHVDKSVADALGKTAAQYASENNHLNVQQYLQSNVR